MPSEEISMPEWLRVKSLTCQVLLKVGDHLAHGGLRIAQFVRRLSDAAGLHSAEIGIYLRILIINALNNQQYLEDSILECAYKNIFASKLLLDYTISTKKIQCLHTGFSKQYKIVRQNVESTRRKTDMIHYSCIGATGYVCGEVLRMMVNHHEGELVNVLDTYGVGDAISTHHPALRGFDDQVIMDLTEENVRETAKKSDVIMIQVPSGDVAKWAEIVLAEDCAIIDIGADIRFRDVDVWEKWYGQKHPDAKMTHDAVLLHP